ncbi:MAG TPA: hypothetical protein VKF14_06265 [Candidatus Dormibacteraeota bacterium]|nr:hypothetical protein [Candidatus Dormibacteraeota bacterium]
MSRKVLTYATLAMLVIGCLVIARMATLGSKPVAHASRESAATPEPSNSTNLPVPVRAAAAPRQLPGPPAAPEPDPSHPGSRPTPEPTPVMIPTCPPIRDPRVDHYELVSTGSIGNPLQCCPVYIDLRYRPVAPICLLPILVPSAKP